MWYKEVKLNEYYHHAKFDMCHIYSVRENRNVKVFARQTTTWPDHTDSYIDSHFSCESSKVNQTRFKATTKTKKSSLFSITWQTLFFLPNLTLFIHGQKKGKEKENAVEMMTQGAQAKNPTYLP